MRMQGRVLLVQSERRGSSLRSWSGTVLTVDSGADFADEGGSFTVAEDPTVYTYTGVTRSDVDESAVLLGVLSRTVWVGFVGVYPPRVDVWAEVEVAGAAGAVQALVPHNLRPLLADGAHGLSVTIERVGEVWQVADVHGEKGEVQPGGIAPGAVSLLELDDDTRVVVESAAGAAHSTHAATDPVGDGVTVGDMWWRFDGSGLVGLWRWDGADWQTLPLSPQIIPMLDAGVIQSGILQGVNVASPSLGSVPRTQIIGPELSIIRGTLDEPYVSAALGGPDGDSMLLAGEDGKVFGFTGGGDLVASSASVESLAIAGEDVLSLLDGRNRVTGWFRSISGTPPRFGSSEMGLFEMAATCRAGRLYEFGGHVSLWCATASSVRLSLRFTNGTDAASTPVPSVSSTSYRDLWVHLPASTWVSVNLTGYYEGQYPSLGQYATRWLWTASNQTGNHEVQMAVSTAGSVVGVMKEVGMPVTGGEWSLGGGTPYTTGTTPTVAPGTRTYKTTWRATAVRSWKLGGSYSDVLYSGSYNGDQRASWLLYGGVALAEDQDPRYPSHTGQSILSALAGASNLSGYTTLKCTRTWAGSGSNVKLSWHGQTSIPGSQPSAGTSPVVSHWTAGTSTRGIPAAELPRLQSGASRGLIIGDNSGQATNTTYAQHSAVLGDSTITFTYTK